MMIKVSVARLPTSDTEIKCARWLIRHRLQPLLLEWQQCERQELTATFKELHDDGGIKGKCRQFTRKSRPAFHGLFIAVHPTRLMMVTRISVLAISASKTYCVRTMQTLLQAVSWRAPSYSACMYAATTRLIAPE